MTEPAIPAAESLDAFRAAPAATPGAWRQVHHPLGDGTAWDLLALFRRPGAPLLVLLPSMQTAARRRNPAYTRWAWADSFPDANVLALSDPALYSDVSLLAGWLLHPDRDLSREAGELVAEVGGLWGVDPGHVLLYGSSMGGFEALHIAATLRGARALAEVPQLDLLKDGFEEPMARIETHVLRGRTLAEHAEQHPEQVSVAARFRHEGYVPRARIVTNGRDATITDAVRMSTDYHLQALPAHGGPFTVDVWPQRLGHAPLPRWAAEPLIAQELHMPSAWPCDMPGA